MWTEWLTSYSVFSASAVRRRLSGLVFSAARGKLSPGCLLLPLLLSHAVGCNAPPGDSPVKTKANPTSAGVQTVEPNASGEAGAEIETGPSHPSPELPPTRGTNESEAPDHASKVLPSPTAAPNANGIEPPVLASDRVTYELPFECDDVTVGGDGRFLIFYSKFQRKLAIFDVNVAKVVRQIPVAAEDVLFTAGAENLIVILQPDNIIQRWDLRSLEREKIAALPVERPQAICMGVASTGPALLVYVAERAFRRVRLQLLDTSTFQLLEEGMKQPKGDDFREPDIRVRASRDGRVFGIWQHTEGPSPEFDAYVVFDVGSERFDGDSSQLPYAVPSPDGARLYCGAEIRSPFDSEWLNRRPLARGADQGGQRFLVPAVHGNAYLSIPYSAERPRAAGGGRRVASLHIAGDDRPLAELPDVKCSPIWKDWDWQHEPRLTFDKRVWLIPDAKLLAVLGRSNQTLTLHRVDIEQKLAQSKTDYLFIDSRPPRNAIRGETYRYHIAAISKRGMDGYQVELGPEGMTASDVGEVLWHVPAHESRAGFDCVVAVRDALGQERFQSWTVQVDDPQDDRRVVVHEEGGSADDPVPFVSPQVSWPAFTAPDMVEDKVSIPLPARVADTALGGSGQYVVMYFPSVHCVGVFDVSQARLTASLPTHDLRVLIAAGAERFLVHLDDQDVILRYRLKDGQRDKVKSLAPTDYVSQMCMGAASAGPVFISGQRLQRGADRTQQPSVMLLDLETLRPTDLEIDGMAGGLAQQHFLVQASPDGSAFSLSGSGTVSTVEQKMLALTDTELVLCWVQWQTPRAARGLQKLETVFEYYSKQNRADLLLFTKQCARTSTERGYRLGLLPTVWGDHHLSLSPPDYVEGKVHLQVGGDERPLATLTDIEPVTKGLSRFRIIEQSMLPLRKRVWFLPHIDLLVTIPDPADRIVLQKIDMDQVLADTPVDYLVVTSQPPDSVNKGDTLRYQITVLSKRGDLKYELISGPEGMKVSPTGELSWSVPAELEEEQAEVMVALRDASEQEIIHRLSLQLQDVPETAVQPAKPETAPEPRYRLWVDRSGRFRVKAELLEVLEGDRVRLKKENGVVITVPVDRLSKIDRDYLNTRAGTH